MLISFLFTHINCLWECIALASSHDIVWWHLMTASAVWEIIYRAGGVILTCFLDLSDALP